uniref:26S proteasome regulatory subunit Rpn7 N-terminal domain-containing protein n=1 Tax=Lactuca sativa TaxID=4236 RepID=A0A9R1VUD2_LACSA|nr:hypothetical protein LSAT_V11C400165390 [Lactuca sativa]
MENLADSITPNLNLKTLSHNLTFSGSENCSFYMHTGVVMLYPHLETRNGGPIVIPGLCLPKTLQSLFPIYLHGLISRSAELRKFAFIFFELSLIFVHVVWIFYFDDMAPLYETLVVNSVLELDQKVLDSMRAKIAEELKKLNEKIADAEENLGESEVREAHLAKSLFYIWIGDKLKLEGLSLTSDMVFITQMSDKMGYLIFKGMEGPLLLHDKDVVFEILETEAFEILCEKGVAGSSSAELLATFCDNILKNGGSEKLNDEVVEDTLEKVLV